MLPNEEIGRIINKEYPTYQELENLKFTMSWLYAEQTEPEKKAHYLLHGKIFAHYWRAREAIEKMKKPKQKLKKIRGRYYYPGYQLDIDHYIEHWLFAQKHTIEPEVLNEIITVWHYEPKECEYLPEGHTIYVFEE